DFFGRYDDREGYTSIIINGSILKSLVSSGESDDRDAVTGKITSIRLVIRDKDKCPDSDALIPEVRNIIRRARYEELMTVRDEGSDIRFMARMEDDMVRELVMMAEGHDSEVIAQISGRFTREEASGIMTNNGDRLAILEGLEIDAK
ncbi:MAG TPA: DUF4252 domain-containing protein, partial [Bacteroidales bacterium]|nr:DUF4252 domain-containing protein [Bacteroidales bacterium]HRW28131.1 DUF4252 domain-containing protein [Bacteroidales bacterium]